jgi:hypothetical protein
VVVFEVPLDGVWAGVEPGGGELLAQLDDQVDGLGRGGGRDSVRPPRVGLEGGITLTAVAVQE